MAQKNNEQKLLAQLASANERLRGANTGLTILRRGSALSLRGMLPPKEGGTRSRQVISLQRMGIRFNAAGIQAAEKEAYKICGLLARNEFDWQPYLKEKGRSDILSEVIERFEADYFTRRDNTPLTRHTYKREYGLVFNRLDKDAPISKEMLMEAIASTNPNTRTRKRFCTVLGQLAEFAKIELDAKRYEGNYSSRSVVPRDIPSDEEIVRIYESIPHRGWQMVFGLMACYGLRNCEALPQNIELETLQESPGIILVHSAKTGRPRRVFPCYPEWWEMWRLWEVEKLPQVTGATNTDLGHRVTQALKRYGFRNPYNLRHAYSARLIKFQINNSFAALMQGHSEKIHAQVYQAWMNEGDYSEMFEAFMMRRDRPMPPS